MTSQTIKLGSPPIIEAVIDIDCDMPPQPDTPELDAATKQLVMHVGLQDWASEIDMRKLTLAEITLLGTYTYTTADLRATVDALARGVFGDLAWPAGHAVPDSRRATDRSVAPQRLLVQPLGPVRQPR